MSPRASAAAFITGLVLAATALLGCAPDTPTTPPQSSSATATPEPTGEASTRPTATPTPTSAPIALPTDCRAILSDSVLAEIGDTPLNPPNFVPNGVQPDGSLICVWRDPRADTSGLITTISAMNRGPALDMLNALAANEGFTCYTPDNGTRCEREWPNQTYPVTDGRTLFWRDGIMIDTRYSNFAPAGYTSSIVENLFGG